MRLYLHFLFFILPVIGFSQNTATVNKDSVQVKKDSTFTFRVCLANYYGDSASVEQIKKWEEITKREVYIYRDPQYLDRKIIRTYVHYYSGWFLYRADAEKYAKELNKKGLSKAYVAEFYKGRLSEIICRYPINKN